MKNENLLLVLAAVAALYFYSKSKKTAATTTTPPVTTPPNSTSGGAGDYGSILSGLGSLLGDTGVFNNSSGNNGGSYSGYHSYGYA